MTRTHLPASLRSWLIDHHGVVTTATMRSYGVGRKAQARLIEIGILRPITRGSYALTTIEQTLEHRCAVVCAAHPEGFVTGPTAGVMAGLRRQPPAALQFVTAHGRRIDPIPGVRFRQSTKIAAADRRRRPDGIVVASWPRLAFDLAGDLRQLDHRSVVDQLLDRGLVTAEDLAAAARRLCHPARRGSATFLATLDALGGAAHQSHPELLVGEALRARGVPVETQVPVLTADGVTFHVDLGVAGARWGVEIDVHPEHRSTEGHQRDSSRVRALHSRDWWIEPVAERDLLDVEALADELAALYRERARSIGGLADPTWCASGLGSAPGLG